MQNLISQVENRCDLSSAEVEDAVASLLSEKIDDTTKASFLKALRTKGETAQEIAAFVKALLDRAVDPKIDAAQLRGPLLDVCGTGGDHMDLFNVSTTSMFLLAAGGAVIVKHGNRGITSRCGGADVLEELGVQIDLVPDDLRKCVETIGIGFLFAPHYHPAFKMIMPVRKMLAAQKITTVFNILGPLLNPARPTHQLVGVFSKSLLQKFAEVFVILNRKHAWAVHGTVSDNKGVDELSTMGPSYVKKVTRSGIEDFLINPEDLGFQKVTVSELMGGDKAENADILVRILDGTIHGPKRDVVILNAAAGFVITDLARDLSQGILMASEQIDSGHALEKLRKLQEFCT